MNWKTIFNPFLKFDEKVLIIIGIVAFGLNILGCYYAESVNDSIFHYYTFEEPQEIGYIAKINTMSYVLAIVILFILGKILNGKTRWIDITNTVLISQIPLAMAIPFNGLPFYKESLNHIMQNMNSPANIPLESLALVGIWGFVSLFFLIYSIVLYYNGFKTATNIKKWQHIVAFALVSIVITFISQIIF